MLEKTSLNSAVLVYEYAKINWDSAYLSQCREYGTWWMTERPLSESVQLQKLYFPPHIFQQDFDE